ncbi:MAG TPA: carboxypeptidase-like regulatory domain-containing protein [Thermoanaerobaculia bacterium]|nr:carboxypeptidase-like regulatory domain-containing protein [Thermoanaerobaculia bacterium]
MSAETPTRKDTAAPLGRASVFAYELARASVTKVVTGTDGGFRFDGLPAGVYKLIAFKPGFEPGVVLLSRAAAEAVQFVELKLAAEQRDDGHPGDDFWSLRDEIPADVLRDLESVRLAELALPAGAAVKAPAEMRGFETALRAMTGVESASTGGASQLAGGEIDMKGRIGSLRLGVSGEFWSLASADDTTMSATPQGQAAALNLRMSGSGEGQINVTTVSHRGNPSESSRGDDGADFERYRVSWSQPVGERSSSRFTAQYTSQSNFLRPAGVDALASIESRAFNVEGSYRVDISDRNSLETGLRYRVRDGGFATLDGLVQQERALELYGRGGWRFEPSVLVEYGMYTQLRDGSMALAPQGGVVVQLGDRWQATATASQRLEQGQSRPLDAFTPVRFASVGQDPAGRACQDLEAHCYRVLLARQGDDEGTTFAVGALHRELAETLHLYFDDDFLDHLESLYLVQGDQLPEVQMVVERRVAPRVLARLESSYAEGGGGLIYAIDDKPYENRVSYLVTSLDTRFQRSSTGVFLAFHHLTQGVDAVAAPVATNGIVEKRFDSAGLPTMQLERLQLMLSQDLNVLMRLAADWAVHLNFEVSRGSLPFTVQNATGDGVRRRVTGGLSVKF